MEKIINEKLGVIVSKKNQKLFRKFLSRYIINEDDMPEYMICIQFVLDKFRAGKDSNLRFWKI